MFLFNFTLANVTCDEKSFGGCSGGVESFNGTREVCRDAVCIASLLLGFLLAHVAVIMLSGYGIPCDSCCCYY